MTEFHKHHNFPCMCGPWSWKQNYCIYTFHFLPTPDIFHVHHDNLYNNQWTVYDQFKSWWLPWGAHPHDFRQVFCMKSNISKLVTKPACTCVSLLTKKYWSNLHPSFLAQTLHISVWSSTSLAFPFLGNLGGGVIF